MWYFFVKNIRIPVNFDMNINLEWVGKEFVTAPKVKQSRPTGIRTFYG